jgi:hypothetical protein
MSTMRFPSPDAKVAPIGTRCEKPIWFERRTPTEYQALYGERGLNAILPEMAQDAERLQRALLDARTTMPGDGADIHTVIGWIGFAEILIIVALLALRIL